MNDGIAVEQGELKKRATNLAFNSCLALFIVTVIMSVLLTLVGIHFVIGVILGSIASFFVLAAIHNSYKKKLAELSSIEIANRLQPAPPFQQEKVPKGSTLDIQLIKQEDVPDQPVIKSLGKPKCKVCNLQIKDGEITLACPYCEQSFHKEHILEWIKVKNECPVCNRKIQIKMT